MRYSMPSLKHFCIAVSIFFGCVSVVHSRGIMHTTEAVSERIEAELSVGATSEEIEEFFVDAGLGFSYDRFNSRYQSIIRDIPGGPRVDHAIVIHIYVDSHRQYLRHDVQDSFTASN